MSLTHPLIPLLGMSLLGGLLAGLFLWVWRLRRALRRSEADGEALQLAIERYHGELLAVRGALTALGQKWLKEYRPAEREERALAERLAALEKEVHEIQSRQDRMELHDPDSRSYDRAIQLVHRGANVEDLMASCGLSRGEAELVMAVNRGTRQQAED